MRCQCPCINRGIETRYRLSADPDVGEHEAVLAAFSEFRRGDILDWAIASGFRDSLIEHFLALGTERICRETQKSSRIFLPKESVMYPGHPDLPCFTVDREIGQPSLYLEGYDSDLPQVRYFLFLCQ